MSQKQNEKFADAIKTHFADEKKMTEADAKNSELIIEERRNLSAEYRELARSEDIPLADKERLLGKASAEVDKAQLESTAVRTSNERRSNRKTYTIAGLVFVGVACVAPKVYKLAKNELPKLISETKK